MARPGGRTARTAEAVFAATIEELSARPYDDVSVESIAARAGVHKTTVYRRWHTKPELITNALTDLAGWMMEVPDTGGVDTDLRLLCRSVQAAIGSPRGAAFTRSLLAGAAVSAEIRQLMDQFWAARLTAIRVIIDRAVARGELAAGTDAALTMQQMAAPLYYRLLVSGEPLTQSHADLCAAAALAAARAGLFSTLEPVPARTAN